MPLKKAKPTSPGRRFVISVYDPDLHKGDPYKPLLEPKTRINGRNSAGRITVRHRGGGHKRHYRIIDFKRSDKDGIPATVERLEYDPNRSAYIALVLYKDGERRYIIAPKGVKAGSSLENGKHASIAPGNCLPLRDMPLGSVVHCVELKPGKGAQMMRSAGTSGQLAGREGMYAILKIRSGEMRKVLLDCRATLGVVSNSDNNLRSIGKAGANRWRGKRPTVRGTAMNPVDHPHGGGEGRSCGRHPVSPTGQPAKGFRTSRRNKRLLVRDRRRK